MLAIEFVRKYRIDGEITHGPNGSSADGWEHYDMTIRLGLKTRDGESRYFDTDFAIGSGWDVGEFTGTGDMLPDESVSVVIGHIADSVRNRDSLFDDYVSDFIPDVEEITVREYRYHEQTWRAIVDQGRAVVDWLYSQEQVDDIETVAE